MVLAYTHERLFNNSVYRIATRRLHIGQSGKLTKGRKDTVRRCKVKTREAQGLFAQPIDHNTGMYMSAESIWCCAVFTAVVGKQEGAQL